MLGKPWVSVACSFHGRNFAAIITHVLASFVIIQRGSNPCRSIPEDICSSGRRCHWREILAAHACGTSSTGGSRLQMFFAPCTTQTYLSDFLLPNSLHADRSDRLKSSRSKMISIWNIATGKARIKIALCCSTVDRFVMLGWMREWP